MRRFGDVWDEWCGRRSSTTLRELRDAIVSQPRDDRALGEATQLLREARFGDAQRRMLAAMPRWFLSPGAHNLLALTHKGLGNEDAAADERALSGLGLRTIAESGDGTRFRPWIVLRVSDEYDVCMAGGKHPTGQSTYDGDLDRIDCHDGTTAWFRIHRARAGVSR